MSHTTTIKSVPIRDVTALRQAVQRLQAKGIKCSLKENARPRMYFREQEVQCDYVLHLEEGKYDVGFQKQKDGSYAPIFDEWNGYVAKDLKNPSCPVPQNAEQRSMAHIGMFSQEYARCAAVNTASAQGYYVVSETVDQATGEYQLEFAR